MPRKFSSTSVDTTIATTPLAPGDTSVTVASGADLTNGLGFAPGDTFVVALAPDTAAEEVCVVTGVSSNTLTITRGQAGTSATTHPIGTTVRHVLTSISLTDFETARNNQVDKTIVNAKGDLIAGTANDTVARLGVGTNGQVLTADSAQTTGLTWSTPSDVSSSSSTTFTNKTISLANNTVTGTTAQFNTALSDGSFATLAGAETLTNKTISGGTVNATTLQQGGVAAVTTSGTQTLTNKTLTTPVISTISNTGTLTLPTSTDTLVGRATTDTLTNKTITTPIISIGLNARVAAYTLAATDRNKLVTIDSSSTANFTVPSGVFSAGDVVYIARLGTGAVAATASGTTVNGTPGLNLRARYSTAAIICIASNTFLLVGDLSA
jgi:hypothetical protein